jgi:hypothetical protein
MKKVLKISVGLLFSLLAAFMVAAPVADFVRVDPIKATAAVIGVGGITSILAPTGVLSMAITKELWVNQIIEMLFKDNGFLKFAYNADEYVLAGKVVHITRANSKPGVVKNRSSLPATVVSRNHEDITYALNEFTTNPELIKDAEKVELAYDKLASVLEQHFGTLNETVADEMIYNWVTSSGGVTDTSLQLRTLGAGTAAHTASATGLRKALTKESLKAARTLMNKNKIPKQDRYALIDSDMMDQLMNDDDLKKRDSSMELDIKNGIVTRLYGFDLIERSDVLVYDNTGTPVVKAPGAAGAAADNAAAICWQKNSVERALGEVKVFDDEGKPEYFGDVYSALVRMGGRIRRKEGVVSIIQEATS